jgi:ATP-binding cassette subfamily F protein uup
MSVIQIKNLTKSYDNREILHEISLTVNENERIGIVGHNGAGKSTLFKLITGQLEQDSGEIIRKNDMTIGILHQDPILNAEQTIRESVENAVLPFKNAKNELDQINKSLATSTSQSLLNRQAELHVYLDTMDGWNYERRVEEVLSKLQLPASDVILGTLSTGMKKRVALANILIQCPDFILLDEPTNHLDTESIDWLEKWILNFKGSCLFVTHDRYFLDRLATRIIEVEQATLFQHNGNYGSYLEAKEIRDSQNKNRATKLDKLLKVELEFSRQGVKARRTKPKFRETKAEGLQEQRDSLLFRKEINLQMQTTFSFANTILQIEDLSVGYDKPLFSHLSVNIQPGTVTGIIGRNGSGKSSFLKAITGEVKILNGTIEKGRGIKIGVFSQNLENLNMEISLLKNVGEGREYFERGQQKYRVDSLLEDMLFSSRDFGRKVKDLSGGEKARASLASLIAKGSNLLLFDEPTNNLDLPTIQALEAILLNFDGAALIVTHDRFFLDKVADEIIYFQNDSAFLFKGNYSLYLENAKANSKIQAAAQNNASPQNEKPKNRTKKKAGNQERQEFAKIEKEIEMLEKAIPELEASLLKPEVHQNFEKAKQIAISLKEKQTALEKASNRWNELADLF